MQQHARLPRFLAPEVFPYASVEIVHVDNSVTVVRARPVVDVAIIPDSETAGVVDIALGQALDEADLEQLETYAGDEGSRCGGGCGFCGRCH